MFCRLLEGSHDLVYFESNLHEDERGYFCERYNKEDFKKYVGSDLSLFQSNESCSKINVLRGLHYQPNKPQGKLVTVIKGIALDIAVDLRKKSNTYGHFETMILSEKNKHKLFIPKGFAHGFLVLSHSAIISYKVDNYYNPDYENGVLWNDSDLDIDWKLDDSEITLSEKDRNLLPLSKINNPF